MYHKIKFLGLPLLAFIGACSLNNKTGAASPIVPACESSLVASGRNGALLFEDLASGLELIHKHSEPNIFGGYYDCESNILVAPFAYREQGSKGFGVDVTYLSSGKTKKYIIDGGMNAPIARYKNGVLINTGIVNSEPYDPNDGYAAPSNVAPNPVSGVSTRIFEYSRFFIPASGEIEKSYEHSIYNAEIIGGYLIGSADDKVIVKMNLETGKTEHVYTGSSKSNNDVRELSFPASSIIVAAGGNIFYVTNSLSYDKDDAGSKSLNKFKENAIYQVSDGNLLEVAVLPNEPSLAARTGTSLSIVDSDIETISVFNTDDKSVNTHQIPGKTEGKWTPISLARTKRSYIVAIKDKDGGPRSALLVIDKDFTRSHIVELGDLDIRSLTTESDFQTL